MKTTLNHFSRIAILTFLLLLELAATSQILNLERRRIENDSLEYTLLNVGSDFSLFNRSAAADAPVNLLGFNNSLNFIRKKNRHALIVIAQNNFLRINENPFLNTGFAHVRGHFNRMEKRSFEVYSQYSYDNFRQLNPRILLGSNFRLRVIQSDRVTLSMGMGPMFEYEQWTHPVTEEIVEVDFVKLNSYYVLRLVLSDNFEYNGSTYFQSGYDSSIDKLRNRIAHTSNLIARVTGRLSLTVSFDMNYEDRPIVPITPFIFNVRNGLLYDLK